MNWGDFKKQVEEQDVVDETEIYIIDTSGNWTTNLKVQVHFEDNTATIYAYDT